MHISGELTRDDLVPGGSSTGKDSATNIRRKDATFNSYINPGKDALWPDQYTTINGLAATHPKILGAPKMDVVWFEFEQWTQKTTTTNETIILVAYNGEKCDLN